MFQITLKQFQDIVEQSLVELPKEFAEKMENVDILVEIWPTPDEMQSIRAHPSSLLFGLYRGVPKTKRLSSYSSLPDKIQIFAGPIMMVSSDFADLQKRIRDTVFHEIGHHFGLSDEQIYRAVKPHVTKRL